MSESKRFEFYSDEDLIGVLDTVTGRTFNSFEIVDLLNDQQATIRKLQDLCGESDSENAKLRIENKRLQKELNDCEKFRYQVFKRLNDEHIKECSIK